MTEPCTFEADTSCCSDWATFDQATKDRAEAWASYVLWALTGRQFGLCDISVRPCYRRCTPRSYATFGVWMDRGGGQQMWLPFVDDVGEWRNCGCCGICCCGVSCEVWLPGPVASVSAVLVNNAAVAPAAYRIDNGNLLVRHDGLCWPECANLDVPPESTNNTFVVTYKRGRDWPIAGNLALGELACEFGKGCTGAECALPQNVVSVSRAGVQFEMVPIDTQFEKGLTGLANVDRFIRAVNPKGLVDEPYVISLDLMEPRQQTWPFP